MTHSPEPWVWHTSNSWRRLYHEPRPEAFITRPPARNRVPTSVLMPFVSQADGHPDIQVSAADMALISQAPALLRLVEQYASECGECAGAGVTVEDEDCAECKFIRDVIALAKASI